MEQVVDMFENTIKLHLGIAPEGTRTKVAKWKSGFYHIAVKAKVPILLLTMDYKNKKVGIINKIIPTGNFEKDMLFIQEEYKNIKGKVTENYNPTIF